MINRICMTLEFDKEIENAYQIISPGGYHFELLDGRIIEFNFYETEGSIESSNIITFEASQLDTDSFPDSEFISPEDIRTIKRIEDFYIDIDADIALLSISDVEIEFDNYERVSIPNELFTTTLIQEINKSNNIER